MIIDVQNPELNLTLNLCLFIILALGLLSLCPWTLRSGRNRWTLALPVLALLVYLIYEFTMPPNWDIRIDLLLIWPVLLLTLLAGLLRGIMIRRHRARAGREQESSER